MFGKVCCIMIIKDNIIIVVEGNEKEVKVCCE